MHNHCIEVRLLVNHLQCRRYLAICVCLHPSVLFSDSLGIAGITLLESVT